MKILLYFHPHGSTSWGQVVDGVKDIAAKADWHVQEVNVRPTHKSLDELRRFWNPIGAIIDAGAGVSERIFLWQKNSRRLISEASW